MEKLTIQSDTKNIVEVEQFLSAVCDNLNVHNYVAVISMSVLQAVENAIVHGNKSDSSKTVTVTCDYCRGGLCFSVADQGEGFGYASLLTDDVDDEQGRGLFLMKTLSDKMSFQNNGSTINLFFVINGIDDSRALERIVTLRRYFSPKLVSA